MSVSAGVSRELTKFHFTACYIINICKYDILYFVIYFNIQKLEELDGAVAKRRSLRLLQLFHAFPRNGYRMGDQKNKWG